MCQITAIGRGTGCDNGGIVELYWGDKTGILAATYDDFTPATGVLTAFTMNSGATFKAIDGDIREMMADANLVPADRTWSNVITGSILGWNAATLKAFDNSIDCCSAIFIAVFDNGEKWVYGLDYNATATDFLAPLETFKPTKADAKSGKRSEKRRVDFEFTAITRRSPIQLTGSIPV